MANRFGVGAAGVSWLSTAGWSTTSGGAPGASVPGTADVAILDANSVNMVVGTGDTTACASINASAYTGTVTIGSGGKIISRGAINLGASGTFAGAGTLEGGYLSTAGTWTINGTISCNFACAGTGTKTNAVSFTVGGLFTMSASCTINGNSITANGGVESVSTTSYNILGTVEIIVGGGNYKDIVKRGTGGKLTINGNVTIQGGTTSITTGIYDCIFTYVAGTVTVDPDVVFGMTGTNTVNIGSGIIFENLDGAGTTTLQSDLYVAHSIGSIGTNTFTLIGAYTVHFGYGGGTGHLIMYNLGTFISTTTKLSAEGTGTIFNGTSFNGMTFQPVNALQIDLDVNTAGTITLNTLSNCQFGNGRTFKHVAGTVVTTGSTVYITTGGHTFDTSNAITFNVIQNNNTLNIPTALTATTMTLNTGSITNSTGSLTVTTLRMDGNAQLTKPNNSSILNIVTNFYQNGTDALQPLVITLPISVTDFVTSMNTDLSVGATIGSEYRRMRFANTVNLSTFTIAFDFIYRGATAYATFSGTGGGYLWLPATYNRFYYFMKPGTSDAYYFTHGCFVGQKYRVVLTKTSGSIMKAYVSGVGKSVSISGSSASLLTGYVYFDTISHEAIGDVLIFSDEKDATWVAADYAKFVAGGQSTNGQYDATEPNLIAGWHVDQFTTDVTNMKLKYDGNMDNEKLFRGEFRYVDASTSAVPIKTLFGTVNSSINVFEHDLKDIGGGGVSAIHY